MKARRPGRGTPAPGLTNQALTRGRPHPRLGRRAGSLLAELAMSMVMLAIAMSLTVKVLGWVAQERRAAERRERAVIETANLMERLHAYTFDELTPELARTMVLPAASAITLPGCSLTVDVQPTEPGPGRSAKRIAIELRWKGQKGEWDAPVRLTSWLERRRPAP